MGNNPVNYVDPMGLFRAGIFVRGTLKTIGGVGSIALGTGSFIGGAASAPTVVGALAGIGTGLFLVSDGALSTADGIKDLVESFKDESAPSINAYDLIADAAGGQAGKAALNATRFGLENTSTWGRTGSGSSQSDHRLAANMIRQQQSDVIQAAASLVNQKR